MVKFTRPLGGSGDDEEGPGKGAGFPMSHAETVRMLKGMGAIPPWIPDDAVTVSAVWPSTGETHLIEPGYQGDPDSVDGVLAAMPVGDGDGPKEWHLDDIFPHTTYDDPPGTLTPDGYKQLLLRILEESGRDLPEFTRQVCLGLGADLHIAHGVPEDLATQVCEDFAAKVYREFTQPC